MLRRASPPPDPASLEIRRLMLASEGRPFTYPVLVEAMDLARPLGAEIFVMSIARIWGTSLGFPNPGLLPTRREWDAQRLLVREAVSSLEKGGFKANGMVLATRRARKRIIQEATMRKVDAIVMGADPKRRLIGDFVWSQEPHRVRTRSRAIPVYLVPVE